VPPENRPSQRRTCLQKGHSATRTGFFVVGVFFCLLAETALCELKNGFLAFLRFSQKYRPKIFLCRPETGDQSRHLFAPFAEPDA